MLILKIMPECGGVKKQRFFGRLIKRHSTGSAVRYNISVNGCVHTVVEVCESELCNEQLERLFKAYSGKIIVPQQYENHPAFEGKLFDATPYRCLAAVSSLINYMKTNVNKKLTVCIHISGEKVFDILGELLRCAKSLTVICEQSAAALAFAENCYKTYGVKPHICTAVPESEFDVNADFTTFEKNGRSFIAVCGKTAVLYPDPLYFADCASFETFAEWGINRNVLCAAFSKTRS